MTKFVTVMLQIYPLSIRSSNDLNFTIKISIFIYSILYGIISHVSVR